VLALLVSTIYLLGKKYYKLLIPATIICLLVIGIAYPYIVNPENKLEVVRLGDFSFDVINEKGKLHTKPLPTAKAHNLILDVTLSIGILGLLSYFALIVFSVKQIIQSPYYGMEAVAICYLIFTFTWFECAQFTHIFWWVLSFNKKLRSMNDFIK